MRLILSGLLLLAIKGQAQVTWKNVDSLFRPLPASVHVYQTNDPLDGKPNIAYYLIADLNDKKLEFTVDTTLGRRLTPTKFYEKNEHALAVVNCTFFSFATNQSLNVVIRDGRLVGYNQHSIAGRGKDTFTYRHPVGSALGITKKRKADVAWLFTDSSNRYALAFQEPVPAVKDSSNRFNRTRDANGRKLSKWKMRTSVGGGPVLVQNDSVKVTNNEEMKFGGKAIDDKHPRTAMGYTRDNKLVILAVEGRHPGKAEGATLTQMAILLRDIGCHEALNLDGGGSSCLLVNGKETIQPSEKGEQRPVPAVFLIKKVQ